MVDSTKPYVEAGNMFGNVVWFAVRLWTWRCFNRRAADQLLIGLALALSGALNSVWVLATKDVESAFNAAVVALNMLFAATLYAVHTCNERTNVEATASLMYAFDVVVGAITLSVFAGLVAARK